MRLIPPAQQGGTQSGREGKIKVYSCRNHLMLLFLQVGPNISKDASVTSIIFNSQESSNFHNLKTNPFRVRPGSGLHGTARPGALPLPAPRHLQQEDAALSVRQGRGRGGVRPGRGRLQNPPKAAYYMGSRT